MIIAHFSQAHPAVSGFLIGALLGFLAGLSVALTSVVSGDTLPSEIAKLRASLAAAEANVARITDKHDRTVDSLNAAVDRAEKAEDELAIAQERIKELSTGVAKVSLDEHFKRMEDGNREDIINTWRERAEGAEARVELLTGADCKNCLGHKMRDSANWVSQERYDTLAKTVEWMREVCQRGITLKRVLQCMAVEGDPCYADAKNQFFRAVEAHEQTAKG